ncbi:MAG: hypothetical protein LBG59_02585 [Candidatus Peribacteria bacterium]|jgi:hypothetical protein|nr:hypothetical protein [Candidatus Peribacteria bacterium]
MVCTKVVSNPITDNGECHPEDNNNENDGGCESMTGFTQRRRGGASPLNLDFDKINEGIYNLAYFNGKNALSDIFDIAGSKILTTPQSKANTYKSISEYASPTALQISRKANSVAGQEDTQDGQLAGKFVSIDKRLPDEHLTFNELDFFTIYNNGKDNNDSGDTWNTKINSPTFELYREKNRMGKRKENHTFKVISSQIKNISTIPDQLNGITTTKF